MERTAVSQFWGSIVQWKLPTGLVICEYFPDKNLEITQEELKNKHAIAAKLIHRYTYDFGDGPEEKEYLQQQLGDLWTMIVPH